MSTLQYQETQNALNDGAHQDLQGDSVGNLKQTMATGLRRANDNIYAYPRCLEANISASQLLVTGGGELVKLIINSHTAGTIKFWDNTTASGTVIIETITFNAGEREIDFGGMVFGTGLFATIGGTANVTIGYNVLDT